LTLPEGRLYVQGVPEEQDDKKRPLAAYRDPCSEPATQDRAGTAPPKSADRPVMCRWLTTGEMARETGTTLRTVRFYEGEGLIAAQEREDHGRRRFPEAELAKLQAIADLRDSGLSLQEIKDLVALKAGCPTAREAASRMSGALSAQLEVLDRRIATLQRVRTELAALSDALGTCLGCTHPEFPVRCRDCDSVSTRDATRPTMLLWRH
jgi:DNA-binding transcriptional MerR regulator